MEHHFVFAALAIDEEPLLHLGQGCDRPIGGRHQNFGDCWVHAVARPAGSLLCDLQCVQVIKASAGQAICDGI